MSDMVEKVARAIDPEAFDLPRDTRGAAQKWRLRTAKARKLARAAIEAMREPTEAMEKATSDIVVGTDGEYGESNIYCSDYVANKIWCAMIEAALSNSKGGEG